jgi:hypothetical protein
VSRTGSEPLESFTNFAALIVVAEGGQRAACAAGAANSATTSAAARSITASGDYPRLVGWPSRDGTTLSQTVPGEISTEQFLVAWSIAAAAGIAVFLHADRHGSKHTTAWGIGVFLFLGLVLPIYVIHAYRNRRR